MEAYVIIQDTLEILDKKDEVNKIIEHQFINVFFSLKSAAVYFDDILEKEKYNGFNPCTFPEQFLIDGFASDCTLLLTFKKENKKTLYHQFFIMVKEINESKHFPIQVENIVRCNKFNCYTHPHEFNFIIGIIERTTGVEL